MISHETVGGISAFEEGELIKKVAIFHVIVFQDVASPTSGAHQSKVSKDRGEMHVVQRSDCDQRWITNKKSTALEKNDKASDHKASVQESKAINLEGISYIQTFYNS